MLKNESVIKVRVLRAFTVGIGGRKGVFTIYTVIIMWDLIYAG